MRARAPRPAVRLLIGAALAAALAASLAAGAASRAEARSEKAEQTQDPPPQVFRGGGTTVVVPTTVFTRAGLPEMTLEQDDFRLFDEGRRQTITQFIRSEEPLTAVLLVDTSASMTVGLDQARHLVEQLVVRMRPGDRARVGSFSDKLILHRTFTSDRDSLLTTIRQDLHIGNPTRLLDAVDNAISTLVTEPGRRVILLVTDGCDTASQTAWGRVLDRIRIEEVMVYALQIRTRVNILPENRNRRVWDCVSLEQQFMTAETITSFKDVFQDARVALRPDVVLDQLTTETGGSRFILQPRDNLNALATQLLDEMRQVYLLGFVPQKLDGKFHKIRVEVDGLEKKLRFIRHRQTYLAAPPRRSAEREGGPRPTGLRH
jgi:Ca-activated chloride channel family protein